MGNGSAAAQIDLAHLAGLPANIVLCKDLTDRTQILCVGIVTAFLAVRAHIFHQCGTAADGGCIPGVKGIGKSGIQTHHHVSREHSGMGEGPPQAQIAASAQTVQQLRHSIFHKIGLHTGSTHTADLLLIHKEGSRRVKGFFRFQKRLQGGIHANPVIMSISADKASVEAHIPGASGRDNFQLCSSKIIGLNAVFFCQNCEDVLHSAALSGQTATEQIQFLALQAFLQSAVHLLFGQVLGHITDVEDRILWFLTQRDLLQRSVLSGNHTVDCKRQGAPLVLLDAAVIVGLQQCQSLIFIKGVGLQVQPGRIRVGSHKVDTGLRLLLSDNKQSQSLVHPVEIHLVSAIQLSLDLHQILKTGRFRSGNHTGHGFPLCFCRIQKRFIILTKVPAGLRDKSHRLLLSISGT